MIPGRTVYSNISKQRNATEHKDKSKMMIAKHLLELFVRNPLRYLFRLFLPLLLTPRVHVVADVDSDPPNPNNKNDPSSLSSSSMTPLSPQDLRKHFENQQVLVVGGTKGIGASIVDVLRELGGADVTVVGRSARSSTGGIAEDLSSVNGCLELLAQLKDQQRTQRGFSFVVFTVGIWPDFQHPYTKEGIHKVVALDLVARHTILTRLDAMGLLSCTSACYGDDSPSNTVVMSVLASGQHYPSFLYGNSASIQSRMQECEYLVDDDVDSSGSSHSIPPNHRFPYGMRTLVDASICHDAWLQYKATKLSSSSLTNNNSNNNGSISLVSTFPGMLVSDIISSTFPTWLLPVMKACMWTIADTPRTMGINHASILATMAASATAAAASTNESEDTTHRNNNNNNNSTTMAQQDPAHHPHPPNNNNNNNNVSYWVAPLLQAHQPCSGSNEDDAQLGAWTYHWLEEIVQKHSSGTASSHRK